MTEPTRRRLAAALLLAGLVSHVVGAVLIPPSVAGAYGGPAFAALYTFEILERGWTIAGALIAAFGGVAVLVALFALGRRQRTVATTGTAVAVAGLLLATWSAVGLPRSLELGPDQGDHEHIRLAIPLPARDAVDVGIAWTALGLLGAASVMRRASRADAPDRGPVPRPWRS